MKTLKHITAILSIVLLSSTTYAEGKEKTDNANPRSDVFALSNVSTELGMELENWMIDFENVDAFIEESVELESWMLDLEGQAIVEENPELEEWMTTPGFSTEEEDNIKLEPWMTDFAK
jgi:hypothetical protein